MSKSDPVIELLSFVLGVLLVTLIATPARREPAACILCEPCKCREGRHCGCLDFPQEPDDAVQVKYVPPACPCCEVCTCKIGSQCGCMEIE